MKLLIEKKVNMWKQLIEKELDQCLENISSPNTEANVQKLLNTQVILYGAGIDGIKVLMELSKYSIDVIAFFDIRAELIPDIKGIPVLKPDSNLIDENYKVNIPIILTVKPFKPRDASIINMLFEFGYRNILKATDIFDFYSFTNNDISNFVNTRSSIINCAKIFHDELSYNIYKGFITSHASKQYDTFVPPSQHIKYFDDDFEENKGFQRFIDCGAFTGDTLIDLNRLKGKIEKIALFESDLLTFQKLLQTVDEGTELWAEEMSLYPCGVWSDTIKLKANNGMGLNSHISNDGNDIIQCVSLDQVLKGFKPTFLKMDVEGAEYQALLGSKNIIKESKPDMVISLYHDLRDIWELPLFIHSWDLGYKFYIRTYGSGGNATMLYAFA